MRGFRPRGDDGFSMVEVSIAIGVFAIVATFMSHMLAGGLRGVMLGKRREVATQEANRILEIARSLSYDAIGLVQNDTTLSTDPAVQLTEGQSTFLSSTVREPLIWATNPNGHPFNPHIQAVERASTSLTRYVYVTGVDSNSDDAVDMKRVTVRVKWDDSGDPNVKNEVVAQTLADESGLLSSTAVTPGSSTTTPLTAKAHAASASLSVKSARGDIATNTNAELPADPVTVALPSTTGDTTFRAVSDINCTAQSATFTGPTSTYGAHSVTVSADDDARSATSSQPTAQSWSGSDSIAGSDEVDDVIAESTVTSPVSCGATAADTDGLVPTDDSLPYEKGTTSALGTLNANEDITGAGLPSNTLTAASVVSAPVSQELDRQVVAENGELYANSSVALGQTQILKIPSVFSEGLVRVDAISYGASARGAVGAPSAAPAVTTPTITFRIYDIGNEVTGCTSRSGGYCFMSVAPGNNGFDGLQIDFEHSILQNLGNTRLEYEVHVAVLPPSKDAIAGVQGPNGEQRWTAAYTPMSISSRLKVFFNNAGTEVLLTDSAVDMNLGSATAEACAGVTCL